MIHRDNICKKTNRSRALKKQNWTQQMSNEEWGNISNRNLPFILCHEKSINFQLHKTKKHLFAIQMQDMNSKDTQQYLIGIQKAQAWGLAAAKNAQDYSGDLQLTIWCPIVHLEPFQH